MRAPYDDLAGATRSRYDRPRPIRLVAVWSRLNRLFDAEDPWIRPLPPGYLRADVTLAVVMFACSTLGIEILRSMGVLDGES